jgi:hypothetical protein
MKNAQPRLNQAQTVSQSMGSRFFRPNPLAAISITENHEWDGDLSTGIGKTKSCGVTQDLNWPPAILRDGDFSTPECSRPHCAAPVDG